ncbi:hypothetical protein CHISP_1565 [Chitinispirillum alkaliphilum]|nr:hypothetical protein CHISP_1565 [Chitinispirillum alkaliphilum]
MIRIIICLTLISTFFPRFSHSENLPHSAARETVLLEDEEDEEDEPGPFFSTFGLGLGGLGNLDSDNLAITGFVGSVLEIGPTVQGKIILDLTTDFRDALFTNAKLGVNFLAPTAFASPYLGLGLGLGYARGAGENLFGVTVAGSLGLILLRTSSIQLDLEGNINAMFNTTDEGVPFAYSLRLGVLY